MAGAILQGFAVQIRVIGALLLREVITRYGRHGIGVLWFVGEPMLFTLGIATLWYFAKLHGGAQIPIVAFAITGYSSVLVWRNTAGRCLNAISVNLGLMYHRRVRVMDILMARIVLELAGGTASIVMLTCIFSLLGVMHWPVDMLRVFAGWGLLCWFAVGLGLTVGCLSERSETFERVWHIVTYLLFPLSGAVYMVSWLPSALQSKVLLLPMVHGVEMIRHGYFGPLVVTRENPAYFMAFDAVLLLIGVALTREAAKRVQPE